MVDAEVRSAFENVTGQVAGEWDFIRRDDPSGLDDDLEAWMIGRPAPAAP